MSVNRLISKLIAKNDLAVKEMQEAMDDILSGKAKTPEIVEFLTYLNIKGETVEEITVAAEAMLKYVDPILVDKSNILDTCGTGGDKLGTFNISTVSAFVASGAGVVVAKHGNRSVSSICGSADILEALGVNINMDRDKIKKSLEEIGIAFLFAPNMHRAMKNVMPARKQIAGKTIFNILGPLTNPARATNQLIGVYSAKWVPILARVLNNLGSKHVLVVHGSDGLDEVTNTGKTFVSELNRGEIRNYEIAPEDFGFKRARIEDLSGGSLFDNVQIVQGILDGKDGFRHDIVLLNAGCAIYAADKAVSIKEGVKLAAQSIDSKAALRKLELLKEYSR
ncbi:MAG: anthranilate phosphoribosyltransferase [Candidatus Omnitrophica bacterium]|nr:anthranilate phosphoribosyltransferase [Candidatus Omnitrophota bacterium]